MKSRIYAFVVVSAALLFFSARLYVGSTQNPYSNMSTTRAETSSVDDVESAPTHTYVRDRLQKTTEVLSVALPSNAGDDAANVLTEGFNSLLIADLCDDPRFSKTHSTSQLITHARSVGNTAQAEHAQRQIETLCQSPHKDTHGSDTLPSPSDFLIDNSRLVQDVHVLMTVIEEDIAAGRDVDSSDLEELIGKKLSESTSFYEMAEITSTLSDDTAVLAHALGKFGYPSGVQQDTAGAANLIAACRIFGGCEANSPFAILSCFLVCTKAMSVEEHVLWSLPERDHAQAFQAANAIVAARLAGSAGH